MRSVRREMSQAPALTDTLHPYTSRPVGGHPSLTCAGVVRACLCLPRELPLVDTTLTLTVTHVLTLVMTISAQCFF